MASQDMVSTSSQQPDANDPRILDFTSTKFNASVALSPENRRNLKLPVPNAKTFNNIAEYSNKTFGRKTSNSNAVTAAPIERKFTAEQIAAVAKPEPKKKEINTVLTRMICSLNVIQKDDKEDVKDRQITIDELEMTTNDTPKSPSGHKSCGPIHLLHEAQGKRVRILIRRRKFGPSDSQFSWMTALLIAFDKHHNVILHDVDEFISKKSSVMTTLHEDDKEKRKRHIKRVFLRGDNIQIISIDSS
jgi:small nuclear ribonucleoprotein (snRNP)-like protein